MSTLKADTILNSAGTGAPSFTQGLKVDSITDTSGGNTVIINGIPLRSGMIDPDNKIINGAFDFWQRGTTTTSTGYLADRWECNFLGGSRTVSRQVFAPGETINGINPTYFARNVVSGQTLSTHVVNFIQKIEGVRSYAGQTITLLGWARRSSGTGNMAVSYDQSFGTGGTPSTTVTGPGQTVTLSGTWSPFAVSMDIPSLSGKTIGINGNDYLAVNFWISAGSNFDARTNTLGLQTIGIDLWGIRIKIGSHTVEASASYRMPELGPELARCQRFYVKLGGENTNDILVQGVASTTVAASATLTFPVTMRSAPTLTKVGTWTVFTAAQPNAVAASTSTCSINFAGTAGSLSAASVSTANGAYLTAESEL